MNLPLPQDTQQVLRRHRNEVDNLFLLFYRYVWEWQRNGASWKMGAPEKQRMMKAVAARAGEDSPASPHLKVFFNRQEQLLKSLGASGWTIPDQPLVLETDTRLIAGLGYEGPLEVGLTLHPLYGFPYLPGTAVKGVARAYAELVVRRHLQKIVDEAPDESARKQAERMLKEHNRAVHLIFGSPEKLNDTPEKNRVGCVRFFDALPTSFPKLEVDIMTPHFGPYYMNAYKSGTPAWKKAPGDWHEPEPVYFLTVKEGQPFRFFLAARDDEEVPDPQVCLDLARKWLEAGLKDLGAGGKTAAGYGYFLPPDEKAAREKELVRAPIPQGFRAGTIVNIKMGKMRGKIQPGGEGDVLPFRLEDATGVGSGDAVIYRIVEEDGQYRAMDVQKR